MLWQSNNILEKYSTVVEKILETLVEPMRICYNLIEVIHMKKILKALLIIVLVIISVAAAGLGWLSANEYKPDDVTEISVMRAASNQKTLHIGDTISLMSWNIGYAGLGKDSDFFMDGGQEVAAADRATVYSYLNGINRAIYAANVKTPDIRLFQEVDENSSRTYGINEIKHIGKDNTAYAYNFSTPFVPYPLPPIGKVNSGLLTSTAYPINYAERVSLPCPFDWPVSAVNLKRCLLASYIPIANSDKYLVVVNMHLEAYDDGEGKVAQTKQLLSYIQKEYEKGNYVIAGGDFNQEFPGALDAYPNSHTDLWAPGLLESDMLPEAWQFAYDLSTPTCRLLNQPYEPEDTENTQYYVIDGFILSPNVKLNSVETLDYGFEYSDHNPVSMSITLS